MKDSLYSFMLGIMLRLYSIKMEEMVQVLVKKLSDNYNPNAYQANHSPKEITSLPNMPSLKQLQLSRMNSIEKIFALPE